jgi:hypothetical protein
LIIVLAGTSCWWADFPDDLVSGDAGTACQPDQFIRCVGESSLETCNEVGSATEVVDCRPGICDAGLRRCTACDPASYPAVCEDAGRLRRCAPSGVVETVSCPCENDQCCDDDDDDGFTTCEGDCDDGNRDVRPDQSGYFTSPSQAPLPFDYNCDNRQDPQYDSAVNCVRDGGECPGAGWAAAPGPECGQTGSFVECEKDGAGCKQLQGAPRVQACR